MSAFINAIGRGDLAAVRELAQRYNVNATVHDLDYGLVVYGLTPLMIAIWWRRPKVAAVLLELGADPLKPSDYVGAEVTGRHSLYADPIMPYTFAWRLSHDSAISEILTLLESHGPSRQASLDGALVDTVAWRRLDQVPSLLQRGANVNWRSPDGRDLFDVVETDRRYEQRMGRIWAANDFHHPIGMHIVTKQEVFMVLAQVPALSEASRRHAAACLREIEEAARRREEDARRQKEEREKERAEWVKYRSSPNAVPLNECRLTTGFHAIKWA